MIDAQTYALGLLADEGGEVGQLVGKALRFGIDTPGVKDPITDQIIPEITARTELEKECGDFIAAVHYACERGILNMEMVRFYAEKKLDRLLDPKSLDNMGRRLAP